MSNNQLPITNLPIMSIKNPTLVRFRHFRHFSSLLTIFPSTNVVRALQIHLFLQNEPNFRKSQVNVTVLLAREYVQMDTWSIGKNKAKTNPKQTQFKANSKPIRTQFKPKQSQLIVSLSNLFQTPNLLIDRMKQNYLPVTLFPLTSCPAGCYNGACSKISFFGEKTN